MAITAPDTPGPAAASGSASIEKADQRAARQGSGEGADRGGFDLGGTKDAPGATGMSEGAARGLGGPPSGSRPDETNQATAGAVRPPQSTSADQTTGQGNPDDAA